MLTAPKALNYFFRKARLLSGKDAHKVTFQSHGEKDWIQFF